MRSFIVLACALVVAVGIESLPGAPQIEVKNFEEKKQVSKVADVPQVQVATKQIVPVSCEDAIKSVFPADKVKLAIAVAKAESGCRSEALGRNTNGTTDGGIMQINSIHCPHIIKCEERSDPVKNARAALQLSRNGTNFNPWSAFKANKHLRFM